MKDKVVIVTGASSGIGRATSLLFAEHGALVIAVGRNDAELSNLRDESREFEGQIKPQLADMTETTQVDRMIGAAVEAYGKIDALVNAAGIIKSGTIEDTSLDEWDKMMNINLRSVYYSMQKCIPHLEETKGNIINVSSVTGVRAFPNVLAYCVSKAGVDQLTHCASLELAPKGIRVNAVNPGVVVSNLHARGGMSPEDYDKFIERSSETHPLGRVGEPKDVAELILFLASDKASWITGVTYSVDGGRAQTCAR